MGVKAHVIGRTVSIGFAAYDQAARIGISFTTRWARAPCLVVLWSAVREQTALVVHETRIHAVAVVACQVTGTLGGGGAASGIACLLRVALVTFLARADRPVAAHDAKCAFAARARVRAAAGHARQSIGAVVITLAGVHRHRGRKALQVRITAVTFLAFAFG